MNISFIAIIATISSSCSTLSTKEKTLALMGAGAVVGGIVGSATTPQDESTIPHAAMWAGIGGAISGVVGLLAFDSDKEMKEKERQIKILQKEVSVMRGEDFLENGTRAIVGIESNKENNLPPEYKKLVKPGKTTVYKLDQWIAGGDNEVIHQDKMIKLEPAHINVGSNQ